MMKFMPSGIRCASIAASVVVVATLVAALTVMRSPTAQRQVTIDQRRVQELMQLAYAVDSYSNLHHQVPPDIATLLNAPGSRLPRVDPVSGAAYRYEPNGKDRYRLCARFGTDTSDTGDFMFAPPAVWAHGAGDQCFERQATMLGAKAN
jgi:hypothetical protein